MNKILHICIALLLFNSKNLFAAAAADQPLSEDHEEEAIAADRGLEQSTSSKETLLPISGQTEEFTAFCPEERTRLSKSCATLKDTRYEVCILPPFVEDCQNLFINVAILLSIISAVYTLYSICILLYKVDKTYSI